MNPLKRRQRNFQQQLLDSTYDNHHSKTEQEMRLAIYQNAYRSRLIESLKRDYKTLCALLGENSFHELANRYIGSYPSRFHSIRWFGKYFPQCIKQDPTYTDKSAYYEMAIFEWLLTEVFDAKDCNVLTVEDMLTLQPNNWPSLQFIFHDSVRYFDFQWNVIPLWKAYDKKRGLIQPQSLPTKTTWLIWRKTYDIYFRSLSEDESWAFKAALNNEPFAYICEGLCQWTEEQNTPSHAASLIKRWIEDDLICQFTMNK